MPLRVSFSKRAVRNPSVSELINQSGCLCLIMVSGYTCKSCGQFHSDLPLSYGAAAPVYWESISPKERRKRGELSSDQCVIDDQHFFVLGRLEIPIIGQPEPFCWLVWVSLSEKSFVRMSELWNIEGREREPPYFGWLSTALPCYPDTINLKTYVHTRPVGSRPYVELEPTEHLLAVEQRNGITMARVQEIAECILHS